MQRPITSDRAVTPIAFRGRLVLPNGILNNGQMLCDGGRIEAIRLGGRLPGKVTVIEADGTVRPCFFHAQLGNIRKNGIEDILNSDQAIAFRRQLDVRRDPICRSCVCTLNM